MTALREDTGHGTEGAARCSFGVLRAAKESRSVSVLPNGDVRAERLMGSIQIWRPTTLPIRDDTQLRLVSDQVVAAAPSVSPTVAPSSAGVALATHSAAVVGVPAASSRPQQGHHIPTATGLGAPSRTGAHQAKGASGESVGVLFNACDVDAAATGAA